MVAESLFNETPHLRLDRVHRKRGRRGRRRLAFPGKAVFPIEAELPAHRLSLGHKNACCAAHVSVKNIHTPRWVASGTIPELPHRCQPTVVGNQFQVTPLNQGRQVCLQLPFRRGHHPHRPEFGNQRFEGGSVGSLGDHMPDCHAPRRLLKGKMPEVGQNQRKLLFVVGSPRSLPGILHKDNTQRLWIFSTQGPHPS